MAKDNLIKTSNIDVTAREVDFVTRFNRNWKALQEILGIMRPIRKQPGTRLVSYTTTVTLADGNVGEGEDIPYSGATITEAFKADIDIRKYAKAVSVEAVSKYGADVAVQKTDDEFLTQLQNNVLGQFYTFLNTGTLTGTETSFQMALAMAKGKVLDKFAAMDKDVTDVVGFVNILDVYQYIGAANVSVQTMFGLSYIKDFMGYSTLFLLPAKYIARNKVIAIPKENIDLYYVDPGDSDFAKLGLNYTVEGETNLIGFHAQGNYNTAVGESFALMGLKLWAEYLDGIAIITVSSMTKATVEKAPDETDFWGTTASQMQSGISVSADNKITGTLIKQTSGVIVQDWGEGYFIGIKVSGYSSGITYDKVDVCINPTEGTGWVTLTDDGLAMFKVTDLSQKIGVRQRGTDNERVDYYDLSALTLS